MTSKSLLQQAFSLGYDRGTGIANRFLFFCQLSLPVLQWRAILKLLLGSVGDRKRVYWQHLPVWQTSANCSAPLPLLETWKTMFAGSQGHVTGSGPLTLSSGDVFHFMAHVLLTMSLPRNCGETQNPDTKVPQDSCRSKYSTTSWRWAALRSHLEPLWVWQGWKIDQLVKDLRFCLVLDDNPDWLLHAATRAGTGDSRHRT